MDVWYVFEYTVFSVFSADLLSLPWPTQERDVYGCVHRDRVVQIFGTL